MECGLISLDYLILYYNYTAVLCSCIMASSIVVQGNKVKLGKR